MVEPSLNVPVALRLRVSPIGSRLTDGVIWMLMRSAGTRTVASPPVPVEVIPVDDAAAMCTVPGARAVTRPRCPGSLLTRATFGSLEVHVTDAGLTGTAWGEPLDRERHQLEHEVKAITYHGLRVEQTPDGWLAEVIVDI